MPVAAVAATGLIAVSAPSALADTAGPASACAAIGGTGASGPGSSGGSSSRTGAGSSAPMLRGTPGISLPVLDGPTQALQLLTGPGSPQRTDRQWGIAGTDLGIAFTGADGETFLAFGDTVACDGSATDWRSNVLLRTGDSDYADGLDVDPGPGPRRLDRPARQGRRIHPVVEDPGSRAHRHTHLRRRGGR